MPKVRTEAGLYSVAIITGPSHVWLGLRFDDPHAGVGPHMVCRPPVGGCDHSRLDERRIASAVAEGLASVSADLRACEIHYVANDSPRYGMYVRAAALIGHYVTGANAG